MFFLKVRPLRAFQLRLALPVIAIVPSVVMVSPARADAPVVGVRAWTTGSQTFVRVRPSALTPPVAKVSANTPLYVWGRFNDWYRVETHDHLFGWVHREYLKSPRLWKVKAISHFKAIQASEKSASQTMYGTVAELKTYHARYGGAGALKGLALKGVYLDPKKPAPVQMARAPKTQPVRIARTSQTAPNPYSAPALSINPPLGGATQNTSNAAQVLGSASEAMAPGASSLAGAVRSWTPSTSAPATPPVIAAPPSTIGQTLGDASNRIERQSNVTPPAISAPQHYLPPPIGAPSAKLYLPPITASATATPRYLPPIVTAPAPQNNASSRPLSPVLPGNSMMAASAPAPATRRVQPAAKPASKAPTAEELHIIAWQKRKRAKQQQWLWLQTKKANDWKWRQAQAQKRYAAAQNRRQWLAKQHENRVRYAQANKAGQRGNLATRVGLIPKQMPVNVPGATIAPISPDELMKVRNQFLKKNAPQNVRQSAPLSTSPGTPFVPSGLHLPGTLGINPLPGDLKGNLSVLLFGSADQKTQAARDLSASGASSESEGHGASDSEGAPTSSSMPVPFVAPAASAQTLVPVTKISPMPSRGGSPRDRAAMAWNSGVANQALSYRGMPYIFGAASPSRGFDCSGLIYFLLRQRGLNPPRTAAGYRTYGTAVARGHWQTGDLILFANTYKRGISHIGVYLKDNKFVHAASTGKGVRVDSLSKGYFAAKYWGARRVK